MNLNRSQNKETLIGNIYAIAAYILWGLLPLYWKLLDAIPADEILAHRIFWSFIFVTGLIVVQKRWTQLKETISNRKVLWQIALCSVLITINWFIYIWAVNSNHIVEASMGYYINPLIVILLGMLVLKERLNRWQGISVVLATLGVAIITVEYGKVPWIALGLAVTFALYGLLKKLVNIESIISLGIETMLISPVALGYIFYQQVTGPGALGSISLPTTLILFCAGFATATPLLWFGQGARRIPLSTMGFYQYIAPTISLTIGVILFKEQFTVTHLISFGFIWTGLAIYSASKLMKPKREAKAL